MTEHSRTGFAGDVKIEYPTDWPADVIERLERSPRWKRYYFPVKGQRKEPLLADMLFDWSAELDCVYSLLKLVGWFEKESPLGADPGHDRDDLTQARRGIECSLRNLMEDHADIIEFIHATDGLPNAPEVETEQSPRLAKVG